MLWVYGHYKFLIFSVLYKDAPRAERIQLVVPNCTIKNRIRGKFIKVNPLTAGAAYLWVFISY